MIFFKKAIGYFEKYYLGLDADSLKRLDTLSVKGMRTNSSARNESAIVPGAREQVVFAPMVQGYARDLNRGAYKIYQKTNNAYLLVIATKWAEKALQFYTSPEILDTYARLLYKQNQATKAIKTMSEAISLQQKRGYPTREYDTALEKMKNKTPL